ncbi:MAG: hypothetical protein HY268_26145 [Deltaproteobacteria bacterium]|nr:hypothetical protein [Deltaproteobacteria bacterium]
MLTGPTALSTKVAATNLFFQHTIAQGIYYPGLVYHLNRVYDALTVEVHRYGGSVSGFSGDAVTCWFDGDNARRAAACAFAIQNAMRPFSAIAMPHSGPASLTVKVAVASGPMRRFLVGDPSIQLSDTLAGTTLASLAAAEHAAEKGEVVFDEPTFHALSAIARLGEWRTRDTVRYAVVSGLTEEILPSPSVLFLMPSVLSKFACGC